MDTATPIQRAPGRWLTDWDPEDERVWNNGGREVAHRNLAASVLVEHLGFSVWTLWSVLVLFMTPETGFDYTAAQKFLLVAAVTLVGALARVPYTLAVPRFGGRNWTVFVGAVLLVPTVTAALLIQRPDTPFWVFALLALTAGLGGGNFSSSMSHISFLFPQRRKGAALGVNAGGGNLGVPAVHLLGLAVIALFTERAGHVLPLLYVPLLVVACAVAWRRMDNVAGARGNAAEQLAVCADRHTWIMSTLYVGTFGSFVGYGFAFGLLLQNQFGRSPMEAATVTFLGPLVGSLARPVGGWLSDRFGGGRVTALVFLAMTAGTGVLVLASLQGALPLFTAGFLALFVLTGVGNGSTYTMIPNIHAARAASRVAAGAPRERAVAESRRAAAALLGLVGAVGSLGGVGINLAFRQSFAATGSATHAFVAFLGFYVVCAAITWLVYLRRPATAPPAASEPEPAATAPGA
ncbi:NNP family nitrate/nitrite transporter-like MFS transporter [Haloactinospora alba]|uniref:NNP family nitrate/nitrite transporter-like MFS transporter n=1 Tax=Haloactinospora alba TaxID=405555 RepID=A0A543NNJ4_9ACTN|nr:nitrate/nitrite transporter [Haloactinospora alba]TQN33403.1 NNP family nitrate/nitrite transporter-like MFS transporter [Haloactinospora alba]